MLKLEHIMKLRLDRSRLQAHTMMPPPSYSNKELTAKLIAVGDATISSLLNIPTEQFAAQLDNARTFGVSYVVEDYDHSLIGISAATSVISHEGDIMCKNVILPYNVTTQDPRLKTHCILGVFLRSSKSKSELPNADEVEVAGWTDVWGVRRDRISYKDLPPTFKSKLRVVMVPCKTLNPINTLINRVNRGSMCV